MKNKPILLYDGTLLANKYSHKNSDRTGVYFVAYNLLLQLMHQRQFEVQVYTQWQDTKVAQALREDGFGQVRVLTDKNLDDCGASVYLSPFAPAPARIAADKSIKKYMILHDLTPLALGDIERPNQDWFKALEHGLNGRDYYFANSAYTKQDFLRFYPSLNPEHIRVAYLAAADRFYHCTDQEKIRQVKKKYGIPDKKPYVLSLCTLQPRKNLVHAVRCFQAFQKEHQADDLMFVMAGGHWDEFKKQLDQEINRHSIVQTGYVDDEDIAALFSNALFTVYVSLYEGSGLPVLEAMQCGCPVITSNVTSMPEVLGDCGQLVDPRDPVALKRAYAKYYEDEKFRKSCGIRGLRRAKRFTWKKFGETVLRFIKETWQKDDTVAPVAKHEKKDATAVLSWDGEVCHDDFVRLQQQAKLDRNNLLAKISHLQDKVQGKIFHAKAGEEPSVAEALNSLSMYRKVMEIGQGRTGVRQELEDADAIVKQMGERLQ